MIAYVAYLRDSGGDSQELSTDQQQSEIQRYALAHQITITRWYRDDARPGSSTIGRDGFLAMIDYLRHDAAETGLVIWRWSRFSRDINDAQFYRADLRRRGYRIISISDNLPEGPEAILFEAALDWSNQRFLDDLSRDVKRGLRNLVLSYGCVPGTPPRGFQRQPIEIGKRRDGRSHIGHRWAPDPDLVPAVQQAFAMRATGASLTEINRQTHLYTSLNSYKTFFSNPIYIGRLYFADLVIDDYCEPIIDQDTWRIVQALLETHAARQHLAGDNPDHPRRQNSPYLLTGLLHCARCGSPFYGTHARSHIKYVCTRAHRRHDCDAPAIPAKPIDQIVITTILNYLANPAYLAHIEHEIQQNHQDRMTGLQDERNDLTKRLASARQKSARLVAALENSPNSQPKIILDRLSELEAQQSQLQAQLSDIERQIHAPTIDHSAIELDQIANQLKKTFLENLDQTEKRAQLRAYIETIIVERVENKIKGKIILFYPPGPAPPVLECESISRTPLGAPPHRLTITIPFTTHTKKDP